MRNNNLLSERIGLWARRTVLNRTLLASLLLVSGTVLAFWPVAQNEFVSYDDKAYVTGNPQVQQGLTWSGLTWAFCRLHGEETYWHPLTWISHMADCQLFGLKPAGHHLHNLLLHALNTVLVFLVFKRMTGAFWRCLLLAALFALHPLQVDTVAWVAERKNLLAAFFWLLTMLAYGRYAQSSVSSPPSRVRNLTGRTRAIGDPSRTSRLMSRFSPRAWTLLFYCLAVLFFALGLMSKPVLVTLPFVLLLLDYWPLQRFQPWPVRTAVGSLLRLAWEKAPFFLLSAASGLLTIKAHSDLGLIATTAQLSPVLRVENAMIFYVRYLGKIVWPFNLAVIYPHPGLWPIEVVLLCALLLVTLSALVLDGARRLPWLPVGWFWFLIVLLPFIGLLQVGVQGMADRFVYLPLIGVLIGLSWATGAVASRKPRSRPILVCATFTLVAACAVLTRQQVRYWRNTVTLFSHAVAVTPNNYLAYDCLGSELDHQGRFDEAIACLEAAVRLRPDFDRAHYDLGAALARQGRSMDEAKRHFARAIEIRPDFAPAHYNLASVLALEGKDEEAIAHYTEALRLDPASSASPHLLLAGLLAKRGQLTAAASHYEAALRLQPGLAEAHHGLGLVLAEQGKLDAAAAQFAAALAAQPDNAQVHYDLADVFLRQQRTEKAIPEYRQALRRKADWPPEALNNMAWVLATYPDDKRRDGEVALGLSQRACRVTGYSNISFLQTLAAAYAECGQFTNAINTARQAYELALSTQQFSWTNIAKRRLDLYASHKRVYEAAR